MQEVWPVICGGFAVLQFTPGGWGGDTAAGLLAN